MSGLIVVDRGEFGWSLCALAPRARLLAEGFDHVTVCAPRDRWPLYEYAQKYVDARIEPGTQNFLEGQLVHPPAETIAAAGAFKRAWPTLDERKAIVNAERAVFRDPTRTPELDRAKRWRRIEVQVPAVSVDVCVAFRGPKLYQGHVDARKAWGGAEDAESRARTLVSALESQGLRVAAIGGADNGHGDAGIDLRGEPLAVQAGALAGARLAIGPSSGAMHLAAFCGAPVLTWYDADERTRFGSANRYRHSWNPWQVPVTYLIDRTRPSVSDVYAEALRFLGLE